jgi:hypothetical protein
VSLFFACPKKRDEKKGHPMTWPFGLPCASRTRWGLSDGTSLSRGERAASLRRPFGLIPPVPAMLGGVNGRRKPHPRSLLLRRAPESFAVKARRGAARMPLVFRGPRMARRKTPAKDEERRVPAKRANRRGPFSFVSFFWASKRKGPVAFRRRK